MGMETKSKVANRIQALQEKARAICGRCARKGTRECPGARCTDILHVVDEIDPLVSEYFRLELAEKRRATSRVWQRRLPFGMGVREVTVKPVEHAGKEPVKVGLLSFAEAVAEVAAPSLFDEPGVGAAPRRRRRRRVPTMYRGPQLRKAESSK